MSDTSPLPALTDCQHMTLPRGDTTRAAERWRGNLLPSDPPAPQQDFAGDESGPRNEEFLRLWPDGETQTTGGLSWWSWLFSGRALQGAVIANGGALIALALLMAAPDIGSKTGLMASATVLGLGLMFAAIAAVVSLAFRGAQMRLQQNTARLAAISGAVSYGALALAAFPLVAGR
jgi:hypothetical protein